MPNQRPAETKEESEQLKYALNNIKLTIPVDKKPKIRTIILKRTKFRIIRMRIEVEQN